MYYIWPRIVITITYHTRQVVPLHWGNHITPQTCTDPFCTSKGLCNTFFSDYPPDEACEKHLICSCQQCNTSHPVHLFAGNRASKCSHISWNLLSLSFFAVWICYVQAWSVQMIFDAILQACKLISWALIYGGMYISAFVHFLGG